MFTFTIIDSFNVTDKLALELDNMSNGSWFVIDGHFSPNSILPQPGSNVVIQKPSGEKLELQLRKCVLRHGSVALQFIELRLR